VHGCVSSARLQIPRGSGIVVSPGATLSLHDVSTPAMQLNTNTPPGAGLAIFVDLGSGAFYGSRFFATVPPFASDSAVVYLNAAGIKDLNAAFLAGGFFSIGGMIAREPARPLPFRKTPVPPAPPLHQPPGNPGPTA